MGGVELCTFKLLDTISRDRLGEECGHGHPGAAVLAGQQGGGQQQGSGQQDIGSQPAGGGNGREAGAVQTEVNEVPPAPCYPSWPDSGYNWRLTSTEQDRAAQSRAEERRALELADNSHQTIQFHDFARKSALDQQGRWCCVFQPHICVFLTILNLILAP